MPKGLLRSGVTAAFDQDLWQALQISPKEAWVLDNTIQPSLLLGLMKGDQGTPGLPAAISAEKDTDGNIVLLTKIVNANAHWLKLDGSNANQTIDIGAEDFKTSGAILGGGAGHDQFSDFVANEHIDWTAVLNNNFASQGTMINTGDATFVNTLTTKATITTLEGSRHSFSFTLSGGISGGGFLKAGEVTLDGTAPGRGYVMPRAGSIISKSVSYDVGASPSSSLRLKAYVNEGIVWDTSIDKAVGTRKKASATQARDIDTFAADDSIMATVAKLPPTSGTVTNVIATIEVVFDT